METPEFPLKVLSRLASVANRPPYAALGGLTMQCSACPECLGVKNENSRDWQRKKTEIT